MQLVLLVDGAVAAEQPRDVVEVVVLDGEVGAADDVDVVLHGERGAQLHIGLGVGRERAPREGRPLLREHLVDELLLHDAVDVLARGHVVDVGAVAGQAPAHDDALEVELAGELLVRVVQAPGQAHAAVLGVDHDLDAVERVAFGVVGADVAVVRDLATIRPSDSTTSCPSGKRASWFWMFSRRQVGMPGKQRCCIKTSASKSSMRRGRTRTWLS